MNTSFRFALTLLSTALLLPNIIGCQSSTPRATSYQMNYQTPDQSQFQALPDVDADLFYKELKPYGNWINHKTYGRVWYPSGVPKNWRPYSNGHWARTQEYGWLWVANEPWGWAPFHYGRWARDDGYGWIWIPGHTWAPAWVFWRSGGGYSAWAPMPPNAVWRPNVGLNTQHFDYDRDIQPYAWIGSCDKHLANHDMSNHRPDISMPNIIRRTNIVQNNVAIVNNTIVNPGPVINVIDAPIVPVTVTTTVPVNVTTTSASTATAVVVQPQIHGPTLEQIAKEEHLAKALAEQNAAAAKEPADKQLREPSRLTGVPTPESIPEPINTSKKPHIINSLAPEMPQNIAPLQIPVTPPKKQIHGKPADLGNPAITAPLTNPAPLPELQSLLPEPPTKQIPVDTLNSAVMPPVNNLVPTPQNPAQSPNVPPTKQLSIDTLNSSVTPSVNNLVPTPQNPPQPPNVPPTKQLSVDTLNSSVTPSVNNLVPVPQDSTPLPKTIFTPTLPEPTPAPAPAPIPSLPEPTPAPAPAPIPSLP
ncbi:MAG: DUF6600 domain-containing protein, partial [Methylococcales bacterium]